MLSKDTAAVLLAPNDGQDATDTRELIFIDFAPKFAHVDLSGFFSAHPLAEWLTKSGVSVAQPWVYVTDQDDSSQVSVGPDGRMAYWIGKTDSNGFRSARIDSIGPDNGEWKFPYQLLLPESESDLPSFYIRLSPSGEWYLTIVRGELKVFSRGGALIFSRVGQNSVVRASFIDAMSPSLLIVDSDYSLIALRDVGNGHWEERKLHSSEYRVYGVDVLEGGQYAILLIGLGQEKYALRRLNLIDFSVWSDTEFDSYRDPEYLSLSDGRFLLREDDDSYRVISHPDIAALVYRSRDLVSSRCQDPEGC